MYSQLELTLDFSPGRKCVFCFAPLKPSSKGVTCSPYCERLEHNWINQIRSRPHPDGLRLGRGWLSVGT